MTLPRIIPILLLIVSLLFLGLSFDIEDHSVFDPVSAAFFPGLISVVLLGCAIAIRRRGISSPSPGQKSEDPESVVEEEIISPSQLRKRILYFLIVILLFSFLMKYVHFLVLSIIYLFVSMLLLNRAGKRASLATAVITAAVVYFVFVYIFKIVFP